jgi:hypothetical protein
MILKWNLEIILGCKQNGCVSDDDETYMADVNKR